MSGGRRQWNRMTNTDVFIAESADAYAGARIWTNYPAFMGTPFATPIEQYFPKAPALHCNPSIMAVARRYA